MNLSREKEQTHGHGEETCGCQGGGDDLEFGISGCKIFYIEWVNNKVLLYSTGNNICYPVINQMKENIYIF